MRVLVITGTTRPGRFSERVAAWVCGDLRARGDLEVDALDLRDVPLPLFDLATSPARTPRQYQNSAHSRLGEAVDAADGFVVLSGEYNHGYPAVLKNAMDHLFVEWRRKPVGFVGWGGTGGARAIEQLRLVAIELDMVPLRLAVHALPDVVMAVRESPAHDLSAFGPLEPRLKAMVDELVWWGTALTEARRAGAPS